MNQTRTEKSILLPQDNLPLDEIMTSLAKNSINLKILHLTQTIRWIFEVVSTVWCCYASRTDPLLIIYVWSSIKHTKYKANKIIFKCLNICVTLILKYGNTKQILQTVLWNLKPHNPRINKEKATNGSIRTKFTHKHVIVRSLLPLESFVSLARCLHRQLISDCFLRHQTWNEKKFFLVQTIEIIH